MDPSHSLGERFTNCILVPQRYLLGIMTSLATFTSYTLRVTISLAITEMVQKKNESLVQHEDSCPVIDNATYVTVKNRDILYDWDEVQQGLILSSFYWGYIVTHIPCALLAEKYGGKHVLGSGMLLNTVLTIFLPLVITSTGGDWVVLVVLRVIMGLGQGMVYPVITTLLSQWVPPKDKGFMSSLSFAGAIMGTVVTNSVGGFLISWSKHWDIVFYFFGLLGLVWNIAWQLLCYSYPRTHPCIKPKEKEYLYHELAEHVSEDSLKTPWKEMLTSFPVWTYIIVQFGHDWGWYTMVTDLPKYMNGVLRFNVKQNGVLSAAPYFMMYLAAVGSGYLADWIIHKKYLSVRLTRQIFGGSLGPAVFIVLASYVGCQRYIAVTFFTLCMLSMGFYFPGVKVNALDLSPNFSGTVMALANGIGVFAGMAAPAIVGILAPNQTLSEWRYVFWVSFAMLSGTFLIYLFFFSAEVQSWNSKKDNQE
ncbi:sialin-like isoform X2 [Zophobas morio]|uniref:sialin-like isoform X2 n=1 Tax=Zophobas morio TaxID=2755281 RepID=UPI003083DE99